MKKNREYKVMAKIQKSGNSLAAPLRKEILAIAGLEKGDSVEVTAVPGVITIRLVEDDEDE